MQSSVILFACQKAGIVLHQDCRQAERGLGVQSGVIWFARFYAYVMTSGKASAP
jgi:hypothetical protein